jgi:hypothetical protein
MLAALAAAAISAAASDAQNAAKSDLRMVSSFVAPGGPIPEECLREAELVERALSGLPRPERWHWVLLCDEAGWQRFLRLSGRADQNWIYASTDLDGKTTYLRGSKMLYSEEFRAAPEEIIAHELAHIRLGSGDELRAGRLGRVWEQALKSKRPTRDGPRRDVDVRAAMGD